LDDPERDLRHAAIAAVIKSLALAAKNLSQMIACGPLVGIEAAVVERTR